MWLPLPRQNYDAASPELPQPLPGAHPSSHWPNSGRGAALSPVVADMLHYITNPWFNPKTPKAASWFSCSGFVPSISSARSVWSIGSLGESWHSSFWSDQTPCSKKCRPLPFDQHIKMKSWIEERKGGMVVTYLWGGHFPHLYEWGVALRAIMHWFAVCQARF